MGAAPPAGQQSSPTPRPIVTAAPVLPGATAAPKAAYAPNVVVYPFDQTGQMDPTVGRSIAQIFSQVFSEAGNLTVQPVPVNAKRADFLTNARTSKADFYVSGYVTPIGNGAAIVEQVVKVSSGVIIYSQTQTVYSVPDATSLALGTHNVILQAAGVNIEVTPQPRATTASGAESSTANGAQVNLGGLGGVLQNIFHGRGKPTTGGAVATAQATPVSRPSRGVIVAKVVGASPDASNATSDLARRLAVNYNVTQATVASSALPGAADSICASNRNNTIASGTLDASTGRRGSATFTLKIYTCFGSVLFTTTQQHADWHKAIDAAVEEYVKASPGNS